MGTEIERKFLLKYPPADLLDKPKHLYQGYLTTYKNCTVRIRISGDKAFLTIKGITVNAARPEYEYAVPLQDAQQMLEQFCQDTLIEKKRYKIPFKGFIWEVDRFLGKNDGLWVAEIELETRDQKFEIPEWIGAEVTDVPRYYNSNLTHHPYSLWED